MHPQGPSVHPPPKAHTKYERASIFEYNQCSYVFDFISVLYKTQLSPESQLTEGKGLVKGPVTTPTL